MGEIINIPTVPTPLMCRLGELLKDWKTTRNNMKARGQEESAMAVEVCAEHLHEVVSAFCSEAKAWQALTPDMRTLAINAAKLAQSKDPDGDAEDHEGGVQNLNTIPVSEALWRFRRELVAGGLALPVPEEEAEHWAYRVAQQLIAMGRTVDDFSTLTVADFKGMKRGVEMWRLMYPGKPFPALPKDTRVPSVPANRET